MQQLQACVAIPQKQCSNPTSVTFATVSAMNRCRSTRSATWGTKQSSRETASDECKTATATSTATTATRRNLTAITVIRDQTTAQQQQQQQAGVGERG